MAKRSSKASSASSSGKSSKAKPETSGNGVDPAIEAALTLAAEKGWRDLALADIAEAAGLSMAALYAQYPSKTAILAAYSRAVDAAVLADMDGDQAEESAKDRLFDLLMRRFDVLNDHREAYAALAWELPRTPLEAGCLMFQLRRSLANMLEAAGLSASGLRGAFRIEGLGAIYAAALRVWLKDDSADLSKTMAELDKRLGQVERCINMTRRKAA
jgi:AcrR family transcriptional regulator